MSFLYLSQISPLFLRLYIYISAFHSGSRKNFMGFFRGLLTFPLFCRIILYNKFKVTYLNTAAHR